MKVIDELRLELQNAGHFPLTVASKLELIELEFDLRAKRIAALNTVNQITSVVARVESVIDVESVMRNILSASLALSRAERCFVILLDQDESEGFSVRGLNRSGKTTKHDHAELPKNLLKQILEKNEATLTMNVQDDEHFKPSQSMTMSDIRSVMAAPITIRDEVAGAIYVDSLLADHIFKEDDLVSFKAFANNAAVALNLSTSLRLSRELHVQSVLALVNAVEAADAYTAGHSNHVGYYAHGIARELGMSALELERLTFAGYLHDVGKIALKNPVSKAGKLNEAEWLEMRKHPVYGERILRNSPALKDILPAVRSHHEKWAGGGYPDNLKGEQIHPYARIVSVADSFDAMTTNRPYRKAYSLEYALNEIELGIGNLYEQRVAEAFLKAFAEGSLVLAETTEEDKYLYEGLA